jgi:hypothetical protein
MKSRSVTRTVALVVLGCGIQGAACAQGASLAPGQVPGAEVQSWLDADGFAVGGIFLSNGCRFIASGKGTARVQSVHCPAMAPFTVTGEGKVAGDQFCSKFDYPDGTRVDVCQGLFKVGENKFEFRSQGRATTVLYRLLR